MKKLVFNDAKELMEIAREYAVFSPQLMEAHIVFSDDGHDGYIKFNSEREVYNFVVGNSNLAYETNYDEYTEQAFMNRCADTIEWYILDESYFQKTVIDVKMIKVIELVLA